MNLSEYRKEIDEIDSEIIKLFERRMDVATKVGKYKLENNLPIFNGAREAEVIQKNIDRLNNKDYSPYATKYFNYIMELSRELQHKILGLNEENYLLNSELEAKNITIGYQGVNGSFSEEAMEKYFGEDVNRKCYEEFEDVFIALKNKEINYGVLPIENSSTGAITQVYDLINKYNFYIIGEQCVKCNQNLIGVRGTTLDSIKEVYSHPQGFEQSTEFLRDYKRWNLIPYHNTAISAKLVSDLKDTSKAAIGSKKAAKLYGLEVIKEGINNQSENHTRFLILSRDLIANNECDKVSVVISLEDQAGTLYSLLRYFAENNINLKKVESRPIKNYPWKYLLYLDFEGSIYSEEVKKALNLIEENSAYFKLLGNYKKDN